MSDAAEIAPVLAAAFGEAKWPPPFAKQSGDLAALHDAVVRELEAGPMELDKTALLLGSLVLGQAAEYVFEDIYKSTVSTTEMELIDLRESRNDTDYRLLNGQKRPVYRLNIKLHGSLFRNAQEVVGLAPEDCFPLATYKIKSALDKQDQEHLPYLFVVVTGAPASAESIGKQMPLLFVAATALGKRLIRSGKRALEERIVAQFIQSQPELFSTIVRATADARWYVFSARRAEIAMKEKLFQRVFALRTRSFNRAYRNAEIDMHLSFAQDMLPLKEFFELVAKQGHFKLAGMLERGTL